MELIYVCNNEHLVLEYLGKRDRLRTIFSEEQCKQLARIYLNVLVEKLSKTYAISHQSLVGWICMLRKDGYTNYEVAAFENPNIAESIFFYVAIKGARNAFYDALYSLQTAEI